MTTDAAPRAQRRPLPIDRLSQVAAWLVVATLLMVVGLRAATYFDAWYLAGSIVPADTIARCPIDMATAARNGSNAGC